MIMFFRVGVAILVLLIVISSSRAQQVRVTGSVKVVDGITRIMAGNQDKDITIESLGGYTVEKAVATSKANNEIARASSPSASTASLKIPTHYFNTIINISGTLVKGSAATKETTDFNVQVLLDGMGPEIADSTADSYPGSTGAIRVLLKDSDLNEASLTRASFSLRQKLIGLTPGSTATTQIQRPLILDRDPTYDPVSRTILLSYPELYPGDYVLTLVSSGLRDVTENACGEKQIDLHVSSKASRGDQVEYPQFLAPGFRQD
ncbi:MAG: hypothetical protein ACKO2L_17040, partial [Planctomycetaceae bacterium]